MDENRIARMKNGIGFIAALDQSGGSTPETLRRYGVNEKLYSNESEMYDLVHEMRTRIITSTVFNSQSILGVILFRETMKRQLCGVNIVEYLEKKNILTFLKIDNGMCDVRDSVCLMFSGMNDVKSIIYLMYKFDRGVSIFMSTRKVILLCPLQSKRQKPKAKIVKKYRVNTREKCDGICGTFGFKSYL